jgi:hypothetical protein
MLRLYALAAAALARNVAALLKLLQNIFHLDSFGNLPLLLYCLRCNAKKIYANLQINLRIKVLIC